MAFVYFVAVALLAGAVSANLSTLEEYPSVVQVESLSTTDLLTWSQKCVGSVLTASYVLSAASCFSGDEYHSDFRRIRAGSDIRNSGGFISYAEIAINHPNWEDSPANDISVIRLISPLPYNDVIRQATIAAPESIISVGLPVNQLGWGSGELSEVLTANIVYTTNIDQCKSEGNENEESNEEENVEPSKESSEESNEETGKESNEESIEQSNEGTVEQSNEETSEQSNEETSEQSNEQFSEESEVGESEGDSEDNSENSNEETDGKKSRGNRAVSYEGVLCGVYSGGVTNTNADVGGPWIYSGITLGVITGLSNLDDASAGLIATSVAQHSNWIISVVV